MFAIQYAFQLFFKKIQTLSFWGLKNEVKAMNTWY